MAQLTGINKRSNENSDSDDDLNESFCEILNQSNETLEKSYQQDMEEERAQKEKRRKGEKRRGS